MTLTGKTKGFTIVEMLTVMGIIAILIGLLIPALNQVKDYSKQIQQKSQFHSVEVCWRCLRPISGPIRNPTTMLIFMTAVRASLRPPAVPVQLRRQPLTAAQ